MAVIDRGMAPVGTTKPDFALEAALRADGCRQVCGVDEAGRGPLAGPVVAAAVILDPDHPIDGLNDSKALTAKRRVALFETIMNQALGVAIASRCAMNIDESDIRLASLAAMADCVTMLVPRADGALFDGRDTPAGLPVGLRARSVIGGDGRSASIAAASIIAKVTRDRMMAQLCTRFPDYGFGRHKGYGAAMHRDAIARHGGVVRVHRFSFRPLADDRATGPSG